MTERLEAVSSKANNLGIFDEELFSQLQPSDIPLGTTRLALEIQLVERAKQVAVLIENVIPPLGELPDVITTIGIYPNGPSQTNGVDKKDLAFHIWYNCAYRPGRALVVNGVVVHEGFVPQEKIDAEIKEYSELVYERSTAPYH